MKKLATIIAIVIGMVLIAGPVYSAATKPKYVAPTGLTVLTVDADRAEIGFNGSPYADFYKMRVSTRKDMSNVVSTANPQDLGEAFPNYESATARDLRPGTRYYVQVAVSNYAGTRLSSWSTVKGFTTLAE